MSRIDLRGKNADTPTDGGWGLLMAMTFMGVVLMMASSVMVLVFGHDRQSVFYADYKSSLHAAEYGLARSLAELRAGQHGSIGLDEWQPGAGATRMPVFGDAGVAPRSVPGMPQSEFIVFARVWSSDGLDNNGDGVQDGPEEAGLYSVYAFGQSGRAVRGVEVLLHLDSAARGAFTRLYWREIHPPQREVQEPQKEGQEPEQEVQEP